MNRAIYLARPDPDLEDLENKKIHEKCKRAESPPINSRGIRLIIFDYQNTELHYQPSLESLYKTLNKPVN